MGDGQHVKTKTHPDKDMSTVTVKVTRGTNGHIPLCGGAG